MRTPLILLLLCTGCVTHPKSTCGPACTTIESATHVVLYPSQRLNILKRVAARPTLGQHEQTFLVNAVFMGGFSDDIADALETLIRNPCCTPETRTYIRTKLHTARIIGRAERRVIDVLTRYESADKPPT